MRSSLLFGAFLALVVLASGPARAGVWVAGGYGFSDELGGFRLVSVSGSGSITDPIVIVEEITELDPVTLVIRDMGGRPVDDEVIPVRQFLHLAVIKIVINGSGRVWAGFDFELQQDLKQPSVYGDGLSFDQMGAFAGGFQSDSFAVSRQVFEPYDRVRFQDGSVDPGATVRFRFFITDPTPVPEFYLLQDPQILMARRWPSSPSLAAR